MLQFVGASTHSFGRAKRLLRNSRKCKLNPDRKNKITTSCNNKNLKHRRRKSSKAIDRVVFELLWSIVSKYLEGSKSLQPYNL